MLLISDEAMSTHLMLNLPTYDESVLANWPILQAITCIHIEMFVAWSRQHGNLTGYATKFKTWI